MNYIYNSVYLFFRVDCYSGCHLVANFSWYPWFWDNSTQSRMGNASILCSTLCSDGGKTLVELLQYDLVWFLDFTFCLVNEESPKSVSLSTYSLSGKLWGLKLDYFKLNQLLSQAPKYYLINWFIWLLFFSWIMFVVRKLFLISFVTKYSRIYSNFGAKWFVTESTGKCYFDDLFHFV